MPLEDYIGKSIEKLGESDQTGALREMEMLFPVRYWLWVQFFGGWFQVRMLQFIY